MRLCGGHWGCECGREEGRRRGPHGPVHKLWRWLMSTSGGRQPKGSHLTSAWGRGGGGCGPGRCSKAAVSGSWGSRPRACGTVAPAPLGPESQTVGEGLLKGPTHSGLLGFHPWEVGRGARGAGAWVQRELWGQGLLGGDPGATWGKEMDPQGPLLLPSPHPIPRPNHPTHLGISPAGIFQLFM